MEYNNDHRSSLVNLRLTSYLDELPNELILIIIEYIDISRDRTKFSLMKEILSFISLSDRYKKLYDNYMKLIYDGIVNRIKNSLTMI